MHVARCAIHLVSYPIESDAVAIALAVPIALDVARSVLHLHPASSPWISTWRVRLDITLVLVVSGWSLGAAGLGSIALACSIGLDLLQLILIAHLTSWPGMST